MGVFHSEGLKPSQGVFPPFLFDFGLWGWKGLLGWVGVEGVS